MIVKAGAALRGSRVRGLLAYLLGPGRHTEHVDPRVVAGWQPLEYLLDRDGLPHAAQLGTADPCLGDAAEGSPRVPRPTRHVWHCIVQNDRRVDPLLSDEQWASIASELVESAGLAEHRWVAVRHDDHGIHIAATLIDEHGARASLKHEIRRLNQCRVQTGITLLPTPH